MKYGIIESNNVISQVIMVNYQPDPPFVEVPEAAQAGDSWDGTTLTPAPDPGPQVRTRLTVREFREQFTMSEKAAIHTAAMSDGAIAAYLADVASAQFVELDFQQTIDSVQALETAGLIGPGRAVQVLTGITE